MKPELLPEVAADEIFISQGHQRTPCGGLSQSETVQPVKMATKRKFVSENSGALVPVKKPKQHEVALLNQGGAIQALPQRTSSLEAPIMLLSGHEGEIFTARFHPAGDTLASAGFDRLIYLWNVYGECENFAVLKGHTGAVMEIHFSLDGSTMFTASTDKTLGIWDYETGTRIKKLKGHSSFVNSCFPSRRGPQYIVSGADDCTVKLWDTRKRGCAQTFQNIYQVSGLPLVCF